MRFYKEEELNFAKEIGADGIYVDEPLPLD